MERMIVRPHSFIMAVIIVLLFVFEAFAIDGDPVYGKKVFENKCASCHGVNGDGNSPMSKHVKPIPANFVSKKYKDSNGKNPVDYSDSELKHVIMSGRKGTAMVGFADSLSMQDINDVLSFIRTLHEDSKISSQYID